MLKQRVITALVLVAVLLPALFSSAAWPFAALALVVVAAAAWEWARLNALPGAGAVVLAGGLLLACGLTWWLGGVQHAPALLWWLALAAWVLGGAAVLRGGVAAWPRSPAPVRWAIGAVVLWLTWLAISQARQLGINFILSVLCIVWAADIAAYFGGRAFGKRKLAPAISPGKSWAGVYSGMAGAIVLALAWLAADRAFGLSGGASLDGASWFSRVDARLGIAGLVLCVVFLAAMSVVGDLFESLVKRSAGAKDSSRLLPGHGGVLDRIDALLPVLPLSLALLAF
jgi:phosphatidate cytidylyltransferase